MPSTYAHRRFGANVLDHLPAPLREKLEAHRELYDIGLHGPDATPLWSSSPGRAV